MGNAQSQAGAMPGEIHKTADGLIYRHPDGSIVDLNTLQVRYTDPRLVNVSIGSPTKRNTRKLLKSPTGNHHHSSSVTNAGLTMTPLIIPNISGSLQFQPTPAFSTLDAQNSNIYGPPPPGEPLRPFSMVETSTHDQFFSQQPGQLQSLTLASPISPTTPAHLMEQSPILSPDQGYSPVFSPNESNEERPGTRASTAPDVNADGPDTMFAGVLGDSNEDDSDFNKKSRRASLFRSKSAKDQMERNLRTRSVFAGGSRREERARRATTMIFDQSISDFYSSQAGNDAALAWNTGGNRASCTFDMMSYEAQRMFNQHSFPVEFEQAVSDSSFHADQNAPPEVIPRVASDISLFAPSRRRSLAQTPGVATRAATFSTPSKSRNGPLVRPETPPSLMERRRSDFEGVPPLPIPRHLTADWQQEMHERAVTPCEPHYMQIGGVKFGTLRIVNGSPEGSPRSSMRLALDDEDEDSGLPLRKMTSNQSAKSLANAFAKSPARKVRPLVLPTLNLVAHDTALCSPKPSVTTPIADLFTESPQRLDDEFAAALKTPDMVEPILSSGEEFFAGLTIDFGNFSLSRPGSVVKELQVTSKPQVLEENLFDHDTDSEFSPEVLDIRVEPTAHSNESPAMERRLSIKTISRSTSGAVSSPASDYSNKQSVQTDSGYGSTSSLRSSRSSKLIRGDKVTGTSGSRSKTSMNRSLAPSGLERSYSSASSFRSPSPKLSPMSIPDVPPLPCAFQERARTLSPKQISPKSLAVAPKVSGRGHTRSSSSVSSGTPHIAMLASKSASVKKSRRASSYHPQTPTFIKMPGSPAQSPRNNTPVEAKLSKFKRLLSSTGLRSSPKEEIPTFVINSTVQELPSTPSRKARDLKSAELLHPSVQRLVRGQPSKATLQTIMSVGSFENAQTPSQSQSKIQSPEPDLKGMEVQQQPAVLPQPPQPPQEPKDIANNLRRKKSFMGESFGGVLARSKSLKKAMVSSSKPLPAPPVPATPKSERPARYRIRSTKKDEPEAKHQQDADLAQKAAFEKALADLAEERKKTINPMLGRMTGGLSRRGRNRSMSTATSPAAAAVAAPGSAISQPYSSVSYRPEPNAYLPRTYSTVSQAHSVRSHQPEMPRHRVPSDMRHSPSTPAMRTRSLVGLRLSSLWSDSRSEAQPRGKNSFDIVRRHSRASSSNESHAESHYFSMGSFKRRNSAAVQAHAPAAQALAPEMRPPARAYSDIGTRVNSMLSSVSYAPASERPGSAVSAQPADAMAHSLSVPSLPAYQRHSPAQGTSTHHRFVQQQQQQQQQQQHQQYLQPGPSRPPSCAPRTHQHMISKYAQQQQQQQQQAVRSGHGLSYSQRQNQVAGSGEAAGHVHVHVHARKRSMSMGNEGVSGASYRMLHSYNSPAYRNTGLCSISTAENRSR